MGKIMLKGVLEIHFVVKAIDLQLLFGSTDICSPNMTKTTYVEVPTSTSWFDVSLGGPTGLRI